MKMRCANLFLVGRRYPFSVLMEEGVQYPSKGYVVFRQPDMPEDAVVSVRMDNVEAIVWESEDDE